jgi:hypothetical protein
MFYSMLDIRYKNTSVYTDVSSVLELLRRVDVGDIADVSEIL